MAAELIASWEEPKLDQPFLTGKAFMPILAGIGIATLLFMVGGIIQQKTTYWFGALASAVIGLTLYAQRRQGGRQLSVAITTESVAIGPNTYPIPELAGFWLEEGFGSLAINLEQKRPGMIPLTCIFATTDAADAREILSLVLPELEARERTFADKVSGYLRL